jgi:hypothetical protein
VPQAETIGCDTCGHLACVCAIKSMHHEECSYRIAAAGSVGIECEHGYDVCPHCDPCTCPSEDRVAWRVKEGDRIQMPDELTWCQVETIRREPDTGRLLMLWETGFARKDADAMVKVRTA